MKNSIDYSKGITVDDLELKLWVLIRFYSVKVNNNAKDGAYIFQFYYMGEWHKVRVVQSSKFELQILG